MKAEDYQISSLYLRGILAGLRHNAGSQYSRLLKEAGLSQYIDLYPPPTLEKISTGAELIRLHTVVREKMSPELYNLFIRNLGREFARTVAALPQLKEPIAQLKSSSSNNIEAAYKAGKLLILIKDQATTEQIECQVSPDNTTVWIIYRTCLQCKYSYCEPNKPCCLGVVVFLKELFLQFTGRRFQIEEIRCGSITGDGDCYVQIR